MTVISHHFITRRTAAKTAVATRRVRTVGDYLPMIVAVISGVVGGATVLAIMQSPVVF